MGGVPNYAKFYFPVRLLHIWVCQQFSAEVDRRYEEARLSRTVLFSLGDFGFFLKTTLCEFALIEGAVFCFFLDANGLLTPTKLAPPLEMLQVV